MIFHEIYMNDCPVVASNSTKLNASQARKLGLASTALSVAGIIITVITVIVAVSLVSYWFNFVSKHIFCDYTYNESCYNFKTYVGMSGSCDGGVKSSSGDCYLKYCSDYDYRGSCYKYRTYVGSSGTCGGVKSDNYCYYTSCTKYRYQSSCYDYKTYVVSSGSCSSGVLSDDSYCYSTSCPDHLYACLLYTSDAADE